MISPAQEPSRAQILIVEDSSMYREMQTLLLGQAGFAVAAHENPVHALTVAAKQRFDLVIIDYQLPDMNGVQFMDELRKMQPTIAVIFVSGALTLELAIQLSNQGVAGIFNKPANPKTLLEKINETLFRPSRDTAVRGGSASPVGRAGNNPAAYVPPQPAADQLAYAPRYVVGTSDRFREFTHRSWKVRDFRSVLLLQGEPGSPFELLARDLADVSVFRDGPVMVCEATEFAPRRLIEILAPSLLAQDAGTLIVTGVESFTADQQNTLENLLTGRDVFLPFARRFRVVLAATPALTDRLDDGTFGETLYYKISALALPVPSFHEMPGDIVVNARHILAMNSDGTTPPPTLSDEAAAWIEAQEWPGNYDQLARTVARAATQVLKGEISAATLAEARFEIENADAEPAAVAEAAAAVASSATVARTGTITQLARSLFRPASTHYDFHQRLTELLTTVDKSVAA